MKPQEKSFTFFETIIALAIMGFMLVELIGVQGNTIVFNEYAVQSNRALWLGKRVLSQVEYYWRSRPFNELKFESRDAIPFEDQPDFSYKLQILDWKLPLVDFIAGGGAKDEDEEEGEGATNNSGIADLIKQQIGDELLKVAHVEVFWSEGAKRDSITLTYLLTNQKALDEKLSLLKDASEALDRVEQGKQAPPGAQPPPPQQPGAGGVAPQPPPVPDGPEAEAVDEP
jgi:hypothetical protein